MILILFYNDAQQVLRELRRTFITLGLTNFSIQIEQTTEEFNICLTFHQPPTNTTRLLQPETALVPGTAANCLAFPTTLGLLGKRNLKNDAPT
eukprot:m.617 g.617  ORF g.617 m.617 type:complete len:93 (-) comp408_c0_seq2:78-356(-)